MPRPKVYRNFQAAAPEPQVEVEAAVVEEKPKRKRRPKKAE